MAKALKCDRCGQFYDLLTELRNYRIRDFSESCKYEKYVDLCPECYEIFTKWLTGEKEQEVGSGELYPGEFESVHYEFEEDPCNGYFNDCIS